MSKVSEQETDQSNILVQLLEDAREYGGVDLPIPPRTDYPRPVELE